MAKSTRKTSTRTKRTGPARDLYQEITDRILEAMEGGTAPWRRTWSRGSGAGSPQLRANGQPYRGINQFLLTLEAIAKGYSSPRWLTFGQAIELGGNVRKGERSTEIVFFKQLTIEDRNAPADASPEEREKRIPMLRSYRVFNADQCEGLPARFAPPPVAIVADANARNDAAEAALRSSGATIREGGDRAFYAPGPDVVQMPPFAAFETPGAFYATLAHELCHWTGHRSRLDRLKLTPFGSPEYAREELVAELGASFVSARLGIVGEHIDNHAAYLASWLKVLKEDKRAIFKAAALAQTAADLVLVNAELEDTADDYDDSEERAEAVRAQYAAA